MRWTAQVRDQARARLTAARQAEPPPFDETGLTYQPAHIIVVEPDDPRRAQVVPRGIRVAAAWAWRLILLVAGAYVLIKTIGVLRLLLSRSSWPCCWPPCFNPSPDCCAAAVSARRPPPLSS